MRSWIGRNDLSIEWKRLKREGRGKKEKEKNLERRREKIGARISVEWNKGMKKYRMKEKKYSLPI